MPYCRGLARACNGMHTIALKNLQTVQRRSRVETWGSVNTRGAVYCKNNNKFLVLFLSSGLSLFFHIIGKDSTTQGPAKLVSREVNKLVQVKGRNPLAEVANPGFQLVRLVGCGLNGTTISDSWWSYLCWNSEIDLKPLRGRLVLGTPGLVCRLVDSSVLLTAAAVPLWWVVGRRRDLT